MSDEDKKTAAAEAPEAAGAPGGAQAPASGGEAATGSAPAAQDGPVGPARSDSDAKPGKPGKKGKGGKLKPSPEEKARAQEEYRRAKTALKSARKRAGKSNAPKVVLCVVVAIVLLAGGAAAGWFFTNQQGTARIDQLQSQLSSTQEQLNDANSKVAETTSVLDGGSRAYIGSWSGDLISTIGAATKRCYGASDKGMTLTIESISGSGEMSIGIDVPYHGHETATLTNDVTRHEGDETLSKDGITSTFSSKSFSFRVEGARDGSYAVVTVSPTTSADAHIQLGCVVESYYKDGLVETDQYLLKKKGDESEPAGGSSQELSSGESSAAESAE